MFQNLSSLIVSCGLLATTFGFSQKLANNLDQSVLTELKSEINTAEANKPVDLSSLAKVQGKGIGFSLEVSRLVIKRTGVKCVITFKRHEGWSDDYGVITQSYVSRFRTTLYDCKALDYRDKYGSAKGKFFSGQSEVVTRFQELSSLSKDEADCALHQIKELSVVTQNPKNQALFQELHINQIHLHLTSNKDAAELDNNLKFGLSASSDPVLTIDMVITSKNECKIIPANQMEDTFVNWSKDSRLEAIREEKRLNAVAIEKAKETAKEAESAKGSVETLLKSFEAK